MSNALLENEKTDNIAPDAPVTNTDLPVVRTESGHLALLHWAATDTTAPLPAAQPAARLPRRIRIDWHLTGIVTLMLLSGIAGIVSLLGMG